MFPKFPFKIPFNFESLEEEVLERQLVRIAIMAEFEAINLYEQLISLTKDENLREIFNTIIMEKKVHAGDLLAKLIDIDEDQLEGFVGLREGMEEFLEEEED